MLSLTILPRQQSPLAIDPRAESRIQHTPSSLPFKIAGSPQTVLRASTSLTDEVSIVFTRKVDENGVFNVTLLMIVVGTARIVMAKINVTVTAGCPAGYELKPSESGNVNLPSERKKYSVFHWIPHARSVTKFKGDLKSPP